MASLIFEINQFLRFKFDLCERLRYLEAMKMQSGTVGKILVRTGESVMVNQVLVEME